MKYALLIYATPGAAEGAQPADDGVIDSWLDYTAALKVSGALLGAEQLAHIDTAVADFWARPGHAEEQRTGLRTDRCPAGCA